MTVNEKTRAASYPVKSAVVDCRRVDADLLTSLLPQTSPTPLLNGLIDTQVPDWIKLRYVQRGYRVGGDYYSCLRSLFSWHNQTLNAWTMIAGSVMSTFLLWCALQQKQTDARAAGVFLALWTSAVVHMPFSVGYHLFMPIAPEVLQRWRALDISFIFVGSVPVTFAMSFYALPTWGTTALTACAVILAVYAINNAGKLKTGRSINKKDNVKFVGLAAMIYLIPVWLDLFKAVRDQEYTDSAIAGVATMFGHFASAAVYTLSFPERLWGSVFDYVGASQQLMHVGVVLIHVCEFAFVWSKLVQQQRAN